MRHLFFQSILVTAIVGSFSVAVAPAANAQSSGCSGAGVAGQWAYTYAGTLFTPSAAVPVASVGTYIIDQTGHLIGHQTRSVGGTPAEETIKGSSRVNSDCTVTAVIRVYSGGKYQRIGYLNGVYDSGMKHVRYIFEALILPGHTNVPVTITADGNRI